MALLFNSTVEQTSGLLLPTVEQVAYSAEELYAVYAARVALDGGTIIDAAYTLAQIAYIQEAGFYGRLAVCASPRMGVKITSSKYDKWYSLDGVDLIGVVAGGGGAKPAVSTDGNGHPVAAVGVNGSRVGGLLESETAFALAHSASSWAGIHACQTDDGTLTMVTAYGNVSGSGTGYAPAVLGRSPAAGTNQINGAAQRTGYDPTIAVDATKRILPSGARGVTDRVGTALVLKISTGEVQLLNSGAVVYSTDDASALYDYTAASFKLRAGTFFDGSANYTASRGGIISDIIVLRSGTLEEHKLLSAHISAQAA